MCVTNKNLLIDVFSKQTKKNVKVSKNHINQAKQKKISQLSTQCELVVRSTLLKLWRENCKLGYNLRVTFKTFSTFCLWEARTKELFQERNKQNCPKKRQIYVAQGEPPHKGSLLSKRAVKGRPLLLLLPSTTRARALRARFLLCDKKGEVVATERQPLFCFLSSFFVFLLLLLSFRRARDAHPKF